MHFFRGTITIAKTGAADAGAISYYYYYYYYYYFRIIFIWFFNFEKYSIDCKKHNVIYLKLSIKYKIIRNMQEILNVNKQQHKKLEIIKQIQN